jgi:two-component system, cell cycle response regulator
MNHIRKPLPFALLALLAAGTALHGVAMLQSGRGDLVRFADGYLYYGVIVLAAVTILLRAALVPRDRLAWALIGAGTAFWAVGDITWDLAWESGNVPYPSVADVLYLFAYPLNVAGVLVLARGGARGLRGVVALDAVVAALGASAIVAALLGPALAVYATSDPAEAIVTAAYPIADLLMIGAAAAAAIALGVRTDFVVLAGGLVAMAATDTFYLYDEATAGYQPGTILDTGWMLAATLIALGSWVRPSWMTAASSAREALPALASLSAIGLMVWSHFESLPTAAVLLAAATLVLAVGRLLLALGENARLLGRAKREALTDSLTELGNRRQLVDDLHRACARSMAGRGRYVFAIYDLDGFKNYNDTFGHAAGDHLLRRMGRSLRDALAGRGTAYRLGGDEFCVLAPVASDGDTEVIVAAGAEALREEGEGFSIASSYGAATIPGEGADPSTVMRLADRRMYAEKGRSPRSFELQARDLLLGVLRERQPGLGEHVEGVGRLASELARRAGLDNEDVDVVGRAADLHDIGKMGIPDQVLAKPGPLSDEEWSLMRKHTLIGERMLSVSPALGPVARLVRSSHERWDGRGYPDGLAYAEIPVGARIIAICDAYEAMTEERPYRTAVSPPEALDELRRNAGTQFDPELVELFADVIAEIPVAAPSRP